MAIQAEPMPSKTQFILTGGIDLSQKMPIAFGALKQLGWNISIAQDDLIVAHTIRTWKRYDQEITIELLGQELQVSSKMVNGEAFDFGKINQKNISAFEQAYRECSQQVSDEAVHQWRKEMATITDATIREAVEIEQAMNPRGTLPYATYTILAINVLLFIATALSGVDMLNPRSDEILKWGGNYGPYTANGEIWRLFTNMFIHIGVIHLLLNSYVLFIVGSVLEPLLGKAKFILSYLASGVIASVVSMWWHSGEPLVSAGASGAIFGLNGIMLALLTTNLIPTAAKKGLGQAFVVMVVFNLANGLRSSQIDNAAHIGGLLAGLLLGYILFLQLRKENRQNEQTTKPGAAWVYIVMLAMAASAIWFSQNFTARPTPANSFVSLYKQFAELETEALDAAYASENNSRERMIAGLRDTAIPNWKRATELWSNASTDRFSEPQKKFAQLSAKYSAARLKESELLLKMNEESPEAYAEEFNKQNQEVQRLLEEINAIEE